MQVTALPVDGPRVELRLPGGWRVLQVGYSTPTLPLRDGVSGAWFFAVAPGIDAYAAFEAAIAAWAADPATQAAQRTAGYGFNYGDAIELVEPAHWRQFGLVLLTLPQHGHLYLDHDDVLVAGG